MLQSSVQNVQIAILCKKVVGAGTPGPPVSTALLEYRQWARLSFFVQLRHCLKPKMPSAYNPSDRTVSDKSDTSLFKNDVSKNPHCKKCSHIRKGHSCQKVSKTTNCLYCPNMICTMDGRNFPCKCEWHLKDQRLQSYLE